MSRTKCPDSSDRLSQNRAADTLSPFRGSVRLSGCPANIAEVCMKQFLITVLPLLALRVALLWREGDR